MKLFWTGTDSLMLVDYSMRKLRKRPYWWIFRRLVRVMDFFVEAHYCEAENIADNLRIFGVRKRIEIVADQLKYTEPIDKIPHNTFTILYYFPLGGDVEFHKWLYGYDIFLEVARRYPELRYIVVNGTNNMEYVFPYVDFYLRPNRHDSASRLRRECDIQGIPYYWTQKNPSVNDAIKAINNVRKNNKI